MNNKEVIEKLVLYFLENDPAVVARCLANSMIDINRILHPEVMNEKERICLAERLRLNNEALHDFIHDGPSCPLTLTDLNSDKPSKD